MAMSDCPKCWNTPCTCGYMGYTVNKLHGQGQSRYEQDQEKDRLENRIKILESKLAELEKRQAPNDQALRSAPAADVERKKESKI